MTRTITTRCRHLFLVGFIASLAGDSARGAAIFSVADLGTSGSTSSYLSALDPTDIAAFSRTSFGVTTHSPSVPSGEFYIGDPGEVRPNFTAQASFVTGNNVGVAVGTAVVRNWPGVIFGPSTTTELVTARADPHVVSSLSWMFPPGSTMQVTSPGYISFPGGVGISFVTPVAINDGGLIVANAKNFFGGGSFATFPTSFSAAATSLGNLGGSDTAAVAMNDAGQVVGWGTTSSGAQHAFFYSSGLMRDLNALIPHGSGFVLTNGLGIDDAGQIVAQAVDGNGAVHYLLLNPSPLPSPVPEPGTLSIFGLGAAVVILQWSRRKHSTV